MKPEEYRTIKQQRDKLGGVLDRFENISYAELKRILNSVYKELLLL